MTEENTNELEELKKKSEEYLNGWKRERADFMNYKKDEMERIGQLVKYANEEIILKLLPVLDNFYLAEKHLPESNDFANGFSQIKKQLEDFLAKEGVVAIETVGNQFDPNTMEAVGEVENSGDPDSAKSSEVVEEMQKGYTLHGKLIRPARVIISK